MTIIDTFPINKELDILEIRLRELWDVVDKFVIVELPIYFKGTPKATFFQNKRWTFKKWEEKIVYLTLPREEVKSRVPNYWIPNQIEKFQRNLAWEWVKAQEGSEDWYMIHGDVDEIPSADAVKRFLHSEQDRAVFTTKLYRYYWNLYFQDWKHLFIAKVGSIVEEPCLDNLRKYKVNNWPQFNNAGWHFSSVGDFDTIMAKFRDMDCFGPLKNNKRLSDIGRIKERIKNKLHPFKEGKPSGVEMPLSTMPKSIQDTKRFHFHLIRENS